LFSYKFELIIFNQQLTCTIPSKRTAPKERHFLDHKDNYFSPHAQTSYNFIFLYVLCLEKYSYLTIFYVFFERIFYVVTY